MPGVNKVIILGNVGQDPEIRTVNDTRICSLSIATSDQWKDRDTGERKQKTEWHRVTVWPENLVSLIEHYVRKGSQLYLEGRLETRKWTDNAGVERYMTEIQIRSYGGVIQLVGRRPGDDDGDSGYSGSNRSARSNGARRSRRADPASPPPGGHGGRDLDDEIPF